MDGRDLLEVPRIHDSSEAFHDGIISDISLWVSLMTLFENDEHIMSSETLLRRMTQKWKVHTETKENQHVSVLVGLLEFWVGWRRKSHAVKPKSRTLPNGTAHAYEDTRFWVDCPCNDRRNFLLCSTIICKVGTKKSAIHVPSRRKEVSPRVMVIKTTQNSTRTNLTEQRSTVDS